MLRAQDIMTRDVITVTRDTPVEKAMQIMIDNSISGLAVVEDDMTLVGILSEKDVVSLLYEIVRQMDSLEGKKVRHFMTERTVSFDKDDSLFDICDFFSKNIFRRVPITSEGRLVGIIGVPDIIKYGLKVRRERDEAAAEPTR
jgi:CBS domain-containing protein